MNKSEDAFEQFLISCEPEVSSANERHARLRHKLIKFFEWRRCGDTELLADETISRAVANLYDGESITRPPSYLLGIAQNVYKEYVRKQRRLIQTYEEATRLSLIEEQSSRNADTFTECAGLCLKELSQAKRRLLERYYSDDCDREELARSENLTLAALRIKIYRVKTELKACYRECVRGRPHKPIDLAPNKK